MQIHLKKGEKLYVNGAVIKADQRCSLELMNNVTFLLENHVMQANKAETPLRQVYFVLQTMLIDPENAQMTRELYWHLSGCLHSAIQNPVLINGLVSADSCVKNQRYFDALKIIRSLFVVEDELIASGEHGKKTGSQREVA
jgi:flagellar biosynthesis repressor protein FlbT